MQKIHLETGEILHRDICPIEYTSAEGEDGILTRENCKVADKAPTILKARHEEKLAENFSADVAFA